MCGIWFLVVIFSLSTRATYAFPSPQLTLPLSVSFGDHSLHFTQEPDGILYVLARQDGSNFTTKVLVGGLNITNDDATQYSIGDCTTASEACIKLIGNDFAITLKTDAVDSDKASETVKAYVTSSLPDAEAGFKIKLEDGVQWFGGPEAKYQLWPVQDAVWSASSYLPKEEAAVAIAEPYWFSSDGTFIYVTPQTSLFVDQNSREAGYLYLYARNISPYREREITDIEYTIGKYADPRSAHEAAAKLFFPRPAGIPNETIIARPIWSTWARYKANISQAIVRKYAEEIIAHGFTYSQIEIDDLWETCYGSLTFDTSAAKFPDIKSLTDDLHELGFMVSNWITPFINLNCKVPYAEAKDKGYFVKSIDGELNTTWWQGTSASIIDFTNEAAVEWFTARLAALKKSAGLDYFKFDAGEASWVPDIANLTGDVRKSPGIYTSKYARALAAFGNGIEVRTGYQTQDLDIMVRMLDKDSNWTFNNGLPTLITTLLVMNMAGYGFVLPDMVGGNGYVNGELLTTELPSKELFIRWLQANTFMPVIQYSFVPWDYDNETIEICAKYTKLHEKYAPTIIEVMKAAISSGAPVNPPVWWVDPLNKDAYNISDQFMLGEVIVVAPVIVENATVRDVFLPAGSWRDANYNNMIVGPTWIKNYPAPLNILPYFVEENYFQSLGHSGGACLTSSVIAVLAYSILALFVRLFD
ncbi:myogenesis-regulating glycosidase-like [Athalia rosae]|uniref:myogenesis-regulating glycosidase-like n=1 Tax=Athalia rosae TaxID=37344 RepID=UPI0020341670|nr:myogenesis-regulating glycosidase-like [Athalia rosae]